MRVLLLFLHVGTFRQGHPRCAEFPWRFGCRVIRNQCGVPPRKRTCADMRRPFYLSSPTVLLVSEGSPVSSWPSLWACLFDRYANRALPTHMQPPGMARTEFEDDSASSQFFWLLFDSDLTPAGKNLLDGSYACFGYTVDGADFLQDIKEGDVIVSAKVVDGADLLEVPK